MIAIYARQSVERPGSISIDAQIGFCKQFIAKEKEIVLYTDLGFSGKDIKRPGFQKLLHQLQDNTGAKIEAIYVYKLDRISRSLYDFSQVLKLLEEKGVRFVSCTEWFDTQTPMGRAMISVAATFAQLERETISQRVSDMYHIKSKKGHYMGGQIPLGYSLDIKKHCFVEAPEERQIITRIYDTYLKEGESYKSVSELLNHEGYKTKRNGSFTPARIGEIIRNPIYIKSQNMIYEYADKNGIYIINPNGKSFHHGFYSYTSEEGKRKLWIMAPHDGFINERLWIRAQIKRKIRFGESLRIAQEHLDCKNFYAYNPEFDV